MTDVTKPQNAVEAARARRAAKRGEVADTSMQDGMDSLVEIMDSLPLELRQQLAEVLEQLSNVADEPARLAKLVLELLHGRGNGNPNPNSHSDHPAHQMIDDSPELADGVMGLLELLHDAAGNDPQRQKALNLYIGGLKRQQKIKPVFVFGHSFTHGVEIAEIDELRRAKGAPIPNSLGGPAPVVNWQRIMDQFNRTHNAASQIDVMAIGVKRTPTLVGKDALDDEIKTLGEMIDQESGNVVIVNP